MVDPEEERVEERLLTDPAFIQEFDVIVDEISAAYVAGQFTGEEKEQVENYFLLSPERQRKVKFMSELHRQVSFEQHGATRSAPAKPKVSERLRSFFGGQSLAVTATAFATLVVVAGLGIWLLFGRSSSPVIATLELSLSSPSRSTGTEIPKISLARNIDELRIKLNLPNRTPPPKSYSADLRGENISLRRLSIAEQNVQSMTVVVPADDLTRGTYAIEINAVNDNGVEEAVRGAYLFAVE